MIWILMALLIGKAAESAIYTPGWGVLYWVGAAAVTFSVHMLETN